MGCNIEVRLRYADIVSPLTLWSSRIDNMVAREESFKRSCEGKCNKFKTLDFTFILLFDGICRMIQFDRFHIFAVRCSLWSIFLSHGSRRNRKYITTDLFSVENELLTIRARCVFTIITKSTHKALDIHRIFLSQQFQMNWSLSSSDSCIVSVQNSHFLRHLVFVLSLLSLSFFLFFDHSIRYCVL